MNLPFRSGKKPEYRMPLWNFVIREKLRKNPTLDPLPATTLKKNFRLMEIYKKLLIENNCL